MPNRIATLLLALTLFVAPFASRPADAAIAADLSAVIRLVPELGGAIGGFCIGSPLGIFGKIAGAAIGFEAGKMVGNFLNNVIFGGTVVAYSTYSPVVYGGYTPFAPSSTPASGATGNLSTLRDAWLGAVKSYEQAVTGGDEAAKQVRYSALQSAEKAYNDAKAAATK